MKPVPFSIPITNADRAAVTCNDCGRVGDLKLVGDFFICKRCRLG